jgi:DNA-binding IclR family transcriptional regulator
MNDVRPSEQTSLQKGLQILQQLASADDGMTIAQLAKAAGFNRATTYRLTEALEQSGWVQRAFSSQPDSRRMLLGPQALGLAVLVSSKYDPEARFQPQIDELARRVGETVHVGALDHTAVVHVARSAPAHGLHLAAPLGSREHAHLTALGKAMLATLSREEILRRYPQEKLPTETHKSIATRTELLAELEEIAARGYAIDDEESRVGVMCVGAPIVGLSGTANFALSVTTLPIQLQGERLEAVADAIRSSAAQATASLGGSVPPANAHMAAR